ncbi:EAL domain-containing protein [Metabacillus fastidiosus]|uniref:bifunctional diguanylate cyclase/phosphodiesterase n=1 Tax=Metabacillus fastidiosus TaxID=1458 RepID=UPI003D294480
MERQMKTRSIIILAAGFIFFISTRFFNETFHLFYNENNFLSFHTLIELLCISIAFSIFLQGWMFFNHTLSKHRVALALLFLIVGVLDILHLLTYKGMPYFFGESSTQKATWLWIISRLILSFSLVIIFLQKDDELTKTLRNKLFFIFSLCTILITFILFTGYDELPLLIHLENGPTLLKIRLEYIISCIFLAGIYLVTRNYLKSKNVLLIPLILALCFSLFAELIFTLYKNVYDLDNFLGHIFKLLSYYFFMKGLYIANIEEPFARLKETKKILKENEKKLNTILTMIPVGITISDLYGSITYANKAAEKILKVSNEEILSRNIADYKWNLKTIEGEDFPEEQQIFNQVKELKQPVYDVPCILKREGEKDTNLSVNSAPVFREGENIDYIVNTLTDITENINAQKKINYLAYADSLTGLPNRNAFWEKMKEVMRGNHVSLFLINLNRFKNINDTLGTEIGDFILLSVANRLKENYEHLGFIAKIGPDEFVHMINRKVDIVEYGRELLITLEEPIKGEQLNFHISAAIGISTMDKEISEEEFFQQAHVALTEAKKLEHQVAVYEPRMSSLLYEKIVLENELREAIDKNELLLHYQPQVNIVTGEIIGVEALLRWVHPEKGVISPGKFIPLAEETGLIVQIGKWVIEEACDQMKKWQQTGYPPFKVSVNLSLRQFFQKDLIETVANALKASGLDAKYLELEITESMTINVDRAIKILKQLKELGVTIAVDDFGTGYSSLSYLYKYPIDLLKIDQSFIQNINIDKNDEVILGTIISMAKHLNLELIAEGVETKEQVHFLRDKKCDTIQGYLISKPMKNEDFEVFLKDNSHIINALNIV